MIARRILLFMLSAVISPRLRIGASTISPSNLVSGPPRIDLPPTGAINGLIGDVVEAGSSTRLCLFGHFARNMQIIFGTAGIIVQPVSSSDTEIIIDVTVAASVPIGPLEFCLRDSQGHLAGRATITISDMLLSAYCSGYCFPKQPDFYKTPGFPKTTSGPPEDYYELRPISSGLGGHLI